MLRDFNKLVGSRDVYTVCKVALVVLHSEKKKVASKLHIEQTKNPTLFNIFIYIEVLIFS